MSHDLWHVLVLGSSLFAAAGLAIVGLAPLVFDQPPPGLVRARPYVLGGCVVALILYLVEWQGLH